MTRALACLAVLTAVASAAPVPKATAFASTDGRFSALFPTAPKETSQEVVGTTMHLFAVEERTGAYMAAYADMPIPANETDEETQTRLDGSVAGMVGNIGGKKTAETKVTLGGKHPGREVSAAIPKQDGMVRARVYFVGTRLYQVMVVGKKEFVESKAATAFLDSLELAK